MQKGSVDLTSHTSFSCYVQAGVLRGKKSRFQLFGDTVNTGKFQKLKYEYPVVAGVDRKPRLGSSLAAV